MSNVERVDTVAVADASVERGGPLTEESKASGVFEVWCVGPDGKEMWRDTIHNVVCTVGKNLALDTFLAGSGYTVTGPFMGLISSVSYTTGPAAGDTMSSHGGWVEAGSASNFPLYTTPRKTCAWAAAGSGSKALSAALQFPIITTGGTVKGAFIVFGTGAVSTIADTNGTLYSAGTFTGGDKVVGVGDTLNVSYTTSM
jgi:hypothetical protein